MPLLRAVTRPWCAAGGVAPRLITAVTLQEQNSTVCCVLQAVSLTPGGLESHTLPVHYLHWCSSHQLCRNLREKGIACFGVKRELRVLVTVVVFLLWVIGCLLFSAPLACMGHLPWSACLPLQLLQSLYSSLRHGPHLFSVNLFILARIPLWRRGQNKPHVSFNDILKISITGRFLYYIKYVCMSKWKVYVKKTVFWSSGILTLP